MLTVNPAQLFFLNKFFSGNIVNGTIGKQMVDTLVESSGNVEVSKIDINIYLISTVWI